MTSENYSANVSRVLAEVHRKHHAPVGGLPGMANTPMRRANENVRYMVDHIVVAQVIHRLQEVSRVFVAPIIRGIKGETIGDIDPIGSVARARRTRGEKDEK